MRIGFRGDVVRNPGQMLPVMGLYEPTLTLCTMLPYGELYSINVMLTLVPGFTKYCGMMVGYVTFSVSPNVRV
jgi:hypothetical protein